MRQTMEIWERKCLSTLKKENLKGKAKGMKIVLKFRLMEWVLWKRCTRA